MKKALLILGLILFTSPLALADDCENVHGEKICWESGTEVTLSWTYPESRIGDYQIEVRDFNWLSSAFLRVTHNKTVKEGMVSEGEAFIFDFANGSDFDVIKIVPIQVSNINPMPANIGTYPSNPNIKMTVKLQDFEDEKKPALKVDITTEGEEKIGSRITVFVKLENSGNADLAGTDLKIYYDGLKLIRDNDMNIFSEYTLAVPEIKWENVSKYRLTPIVRTIVKDGFFIDVVNFSDNSILLSTSYNQSTRTDTLYEGRSVTFNFTNGQEYRGIKVQGIDLSGDGAELVLQFPVKNMLRRSYNAIFEGSSLTSKLSFLIPASSRKSFSITADARGKDHKGNGYADSKSLTIFASNALSIKKMVSNSILGEKIYPESYSGVGGIRSIKDVTYVNLKVENHQNYPIFGARLVDSLPPSFNFVDDENKTSISWLFDINASDFREFRYEIRAKRQGVYNLPKAELIWNEWGEEMHKESDSPRTMVSGPYLGIDRSFSKTGLNIGEPLQVTISVINNGDVPTNVTVNEILPQNASYLSGELSFSGFLNPGEQKNFKYNISLYRAGTLEFNVPEITSRNHGFDWHAPIPARKVAFFSTASTSSPPVAPERPGNEQVHEIGIIRNINEKMPWLEGAVSMITLIFAIFLLLTLNRMNRIL